MKFSGLSGHTAAGGFVNCFLDDLISGKLQKI
jgi:hypothetical protein